MEHEIDSRALSTPLAPGADMPGAPDHGARSQFGHLLFWEQIVIDIYRHIYIECWDRHHQSVFTSRRLFHPSPVHRCPGAARAPALAVVAVAAPPGVERAFVRVSAVRVPASPPPPSFRAHVAGHIVMCIVHFSRVR